MGCLKAAILAGTVHTLCLKENFNTAPAEKYDTYLVELKRVVWTLVVKFIMAFSGFGWVSCKH